LVRVQFLSSDQRLIFLFLIKTGLEVAELSTLEKIPATTKWDAGSNPRCVQPFFSVEEDFAVAGS
jgi:hypothetical protein